MLIFGVSHVYKLKVNKLLIQGDLSDAILIRVTSIVENFN